MSRSSKADPVEKFRFKVTVISIDLSLNGVFDTVAGAIGANPFAVIARAGFSEVTLPKVNINEMTYRENIDAQRSSKIPGLTKYDPITLKRGVTKSRDLYDWYRLVNDESLLLASAQELSRDARIAPVQNDNFRKDVIIEVMDRSGTTVKAWQLFNAFPTGYKGGDDLNASDEAKLVEELTLTYEFFLELEGASAADFGRELAKGAALAGVGALVDTFLGKSNPFTR